MTVIVGLVEDGEAYMASDGRISSGTEIVNCNTLDHKLFSVGGLVIAVTGTLRTGQIVRESLKMPAQLDGQSDFNYISVTFVGAMKQLYKEFEITSKDDRIGMLVGYNHRIYRIFDNWSITEPHYDTMGSGGAYAQGALVASFLLKRKLTPAQRLRMAVEAAVVCDSGCGNSFHMVKVP